MEAIFEMIIEYIVIWVPSLTAIATTIGAILTCLKQFNKAAEKWKNDETIKELRAQFLQMAAQNEELVRTNKLLLDEITKIKNYADEKKKEG